MSELSPQAQVIVDAFFREGRQDIELFNLVDAFRAFVDEIVPHEDEAPRAVFDCEPTLKNRDGTFRHDHSAHLRRQFKQDELNIRWEQRQQTRAMMLAVIVELEQI